ncbi:MAG TPA: hypothetical protein VML96_04960 [Egibacteraceae bacterium]|nr:hypothetical protein [Egibacteraceae bacterium]
MTTPRDGKRKIMIPLEVLRWSVRHAVVAQMAGPLLSVEEQDALPGATGKSRTCSKPR